MPESGGQNCKYTFLFSRMRRMNNLLEWLLLLIGFVFLCLCLAYSDDWWMTLRSGLLGALI